MIGSYYNLLRRWLWLLVLTTLLGAAITFAVSRRESTEYVATTRLLVGPATASVNPDLNELRAASQLLEVYATLPTTRPFLEDVIASLGLNLTPGQVDDMTEITTDSTAQTMRIRVTSDDPELATLLANTIADKLVAQSPASTVDPTATERLTEQIQRVEGVLAASEQRLAQLENDRDSARTADARTQAESRIAQERAYQAEAERLLVSLYGAVSNTPTNRITVIEPANEGKEVDRQLALKTLLGAFAGLVLGGTVMFAVEYFNTTIRSVNDVDTAVSVPVLGSLVTHRSARSARREMLTVLAKPESAAADHYQRLGMHLQFSAIRESLYTLMIADVADNIGAGETAANLAIVLARLGTNVVLVDADGAESVVTHQFGLEGRPGLSDHLAGDESKISRLALKVADLPRLSVLPFGHSTADQFSLSTSPRLQEALAELREIGDLVVIAGPPLLKRAGGFVMASRVDKTLLVVSRERTTRQELQEAVHELSAIGAGILGVLLAVPVGRPVGGLPFARRRSTTIAVDPSLVGQSRSQAARKTAGS